MASSIAPSEVNNDLALHEIKELMSILILLSILISLIHFHQKYRKELANYVKGNGQLLY